ncbi:serine hydrolase domain-containing protein [Jannaschia pohangensis]|uniref:CubicO group peptidase, beta-lactamase class C family n=1 Tax=Jannaschia pohangensis TaxID=390807 RepID=A0A1I3I8S2_9RHOB|nr:serine hydrolase [Jannaschia pohangensis]SFI44414.1 CubicO group peptidase, beta-lactamase class C family [Jannaschia pohangensis]
MLLTRRALLKTCAAASLAFPVLPGLAQAQATGLDAVREAAAGLEQLHSLIVLRDGAEALAMAPRGPGLDRIANVKSVSKTLIALLTGIAIERGHLPGPDARVLPLLGRAAAGDARDALTVGHLLSMQTGLTSTSGPNYGAWINSNDWVDYVLNGEPDGRPGGRFIYSTGGWHVLGAVLARTTGRDLHALVRDWLAEPLGISVPQWDRDPQGLYLGGNQMGLTPRDLARVGEMVRQGGAWNGAQIVPATWIETSWRPRARSPWSGDAYGYGWFLTRFAGRMAAYGRGYGGQVLAVVPDAGLTIVITSDPNLPARTQGYFGEVLSLLDATVRATDDAT